MVVVLPIQELPNTVFGCFSTTVVQELPTRIFGCFSTSARITNRIFGCFSTSTRITEQNLWLWFFKQNLWLFNCQYKNYKTDFCFQSVENEFSLWSRTKTGALVIQRRYSSQVGKINSMTCNRATSVHTVYSVQDPNLIIKFQKSKYTVASWGWIFGHSVKKQFIRSHDSKIWAQYTIRSTCASKWALPSKHFTNFQSSSKPILKLRRWPPPPPQTVICLTHWSAPWLFILVIFLHWQ